MATTTETSTFAQRVRHARLARGMQVRVVEERAGIGHGALRRFELGSDQFAFSVPRIARAMDVDPAWLLSEAPIDPDEERVPWCVELPRTGSYADAAAEIGARLRAARQHRGLTDAEASARAGYGRGNAFSQYEGGRHAPNLGTCRKLARALDIDLVWLLTGQGDTPWD